MFFGTHDMGFKKKKSPHYDNLIYRWIFNFVDLFFCRGPGHLVLLHGIMDSIKYQQIKNQNLTEFYNGP